LQCSLCHEEALPDAFICHRCGALLPAQADTDVTQDMLPQAVTGITQKLSPQDVVSCPICNLPMAEGFLHNPQRSPDIWWVAGRSDPYHWNGKLEGEQRAHFPVTMYRCGQCGYLAAYARPG
jgi:hypothetical protein